MWRQKTARGKSVRRKDWRNFASVNVNHVQHDHHQDHLMSPLSSPSQWYYRSLGGAWVQALVFSCAALASMELTLGQGRPNSQPMTTALSMCPPHIISWQITCSLLNKTMLWSYFLALYGSTKLQGNGSVKQQVSRVVKTVRFIFVKLYHMQLEDIEYLGKCPT